MKVSKATLRDMIPELATRQFGEAYELTFEQGLLSIRCEKGVWLIPVSNIVCMRPAPEEPKKK